MKSLNDYIIRKSTEDEHYEMISQMAENLHNKNPQVGIFWYNPSRNELFGVVKYDPLDKEKKDNTFPYIGAYENKPRGRVFWDDENNIYKIVVGNWINENENYKAIDLIAEEYDFDKEDFEVIIDEHWDIGNGWENL